MKPKPQATLLWIRELENGANVQSKGQLALFDTNSEQTSYDALGLWIPAWERAHPNEKKISRLYKDRKWPKNELTPNIKDVRFYDKEKLNYLDEIPCKVIEWMYGIKTDSPWDMPLERLTLRYEGEDRSLVFLNDNKELTFKTIAELARQQLL